ncbi:hypothetical protein IAU60_006561 [Kwoniella sp. DSM 27419]
MSKPAGLTKGLTLPMLLHRLTKLTATLPGLDASLMLVQYSSPLVITLLLRLAALRARYPLFKLGRGKPGAFGLVKLAEGWGKAAGGIGDARVIMRAFGLLPVLQGLFALHPSPLSSLKSFLLSLGHGVHPSPKALPTLQVLALLAYYPLEHITWLSRKGVVPLSVQSTGMAELWSVRFWALYVLLEVFKLRQTYMSLVDRTKALKNSKPSVSTKEAEGYELPPSPVATSGVPSADNAEKNAPGASATSSPAVQGAALRKDWEAWKTAVTVNSGYAPLTLHWSTPGGLWSNPLITGTLGSIAAVGQLTTQWRKTA